MGKHDSSPLPRALVVDDYPDTAEVISVLLGIMGHETRIATSGKSAIAESYEFDPGLVILDIGLADISGYDVARALRKAHGARPYIVAMTGWSRPEKRTLAMEAGCDDYVVKPAHADTVRAIIGSASRRHRS